jgi:hypothetical protein
MTPSPQDMEKKTKNNTYIYLAVTNIISENEVTGRVRSYKKYFAWEVHAPDKIAADKKFWEDKGRWQPYVLVVLMKANGDTHEHLICVANGLKE